MYQVLLFKFRRHLCKGSMAWRGVAWRGVAWRGVAWRGMWICVHSKDAQKQLARTSLSYLTGSQKVCKFGKSGDYDDISPRSRQNLSTEYINLP